MIGSPAQSLQLSPAEAQSNSSKPAYRGRAVRCSAFTFWDLVPTREVPFGVARRRSAGRHSGLTIWVDNLGAHSALRTSKSYQSPVPLWYREVVPV